MITTIDGTSTIGATEYDFAQAANYSSSVVMASKVWLQATFDLSALAAGDSFQLAFYDKANGGTHTIVHRASPTGAQSELFEIGPRLTCGAWGVTARKISGTDRSIKCTISIADFDANVIQWRGATPAALSTNGFVQSIVERWLTDNAGGTPSALSNGMVAAAGGGEVVEGSYTRAQLERLLVGVIAGTVVDFTGTSLVFKSLDGTKTRLTVTVGATGRTAILIGDLS